MIGYLIGKPIINNESLIILTSAGVGYEVLVDPTQVAQIANQPQIEMHIYTHVREDLIQLFGFRNIDDKKLFQLLLTISGVGPKTALALSAKGAGAIIENTQQAKVSFFTSTPRIGKQLAKKIILELSSKVGALKQLSLATVDDKTKEIIMALESLGFDEQSIENVLEKIDPNLNTADAIKFALKNLNK